MKTIIASDIFGRTPALVTLAKQLTSDPLIVDPYQGKHMPFANEADAYAFFSEKVGLTTYQAHIKALLIKQTEPLRLLGFSVGAAAIWQLSDDINISGINKAVCWYGSQIRHAVNTQPGFPIELVFPAGESHFSVSTVITQLCGTKNVTIRQVPYWHGFMNKLSDNFEQTGYHNELQRLNQLPD